MILIARQPEFWRASQRGVAFALAAAIASPMMAAPADQIELRSGDVIEGRIASVDREAIAIRRPLARGGSAVESGGRAIEATDRFSWDRVARVECDGGADAWPELAPMLMYGESLWRARARLARGDASLAAEALGPEWRLVPGDGPTSMVAALVDLQVALARRETARAWRAFLESARLRRKLLDELSLHEWLEPSASGAMIRRLVVDPTSGICPVLAPFPVDDRERREILEAIDGFDPRDDLQLDLLRQALGAVVDPSRAVPALEPRGDAIDPDFRKTIEFLAALRDARSDVAADRTRGREVLAQLRRRLPEWAEAWGRFAAGSGLLLDRTPASTLAAQIELLHLPARFAEAQPALVTQAAVLAADASMASGQIDEAKRLRSLGATAAPSTRPESSSPPGAP